MKKVCALILILMILISNMNALAFQKDYSITYADLMRQYTTQHCSVYTYDNNYFYGMNVDRQGYHLAKWHVSGAATNLVTMGTTDMAINIQVSQGWVFYKKNSSDSLYKVRTSGKDNRVVVSGKIEYFSVYKNNIYYVDANKNYALYRSDLDGKNVTCLVSKGCFFPVVLNDNQIAYQYDDGKTAYLTVMDLTTKKTETLSDVSCYAPIWDGEYIYYAAGSKNYVNDTAYTIKRTNGKTTETVVDMPVWMNFVVQGDYVYFNLAEDDGRLYRVKKDGSGKGFSQITNDPCDVQFAIAGVIVYAVIGAQGVEGFESCSEDGGNIELFAPWEW